MRFRVHVMMAVLKQNIGLFFNNPSGYVFITIFIMATAVLQFSWGDRFFLENLAELSPLNMNYPYLMLFFIPVLTMNIWSQEKQQGTDEFLLTLPATDLEITAGKFLAALFTYLATLLFSLGLVLVISFLGSPDPGLIFANYIAYILLGSAMLAIGMVASILTRNATIAFILGVLFNSMFMFSGFIGNIGELAGSLGWLATILQSIGFNEQSGMIKQFNDMASGVISLSNLVYFLSITAVMVYLNIIILGKRHWNTGKDNANLKYHFIVRVTCLIVAILSVNVILNRFYIRQDLSSEKMHTFSTTTKDLIKNLKRPVIIQAYISKEVPAQLFETKKTIISMLNEIAAISKGKIHVNIHETEAKSQEAEDAGDKFNIRPVPFQDIKDGQASLKEVFLGIAFVSGPYQEVTPFIGPSLPVEYELARSIRVVSESSRSKIGILKTDAKLKGGFSFAGGRPQQIPDWQVVTELRKQYEVVEVFADSKIPDDIDVLLAVLPSSLTQPEMTNLKNYIMSGGKTMLMCDPFPGFNPRLSPHLPKPSPGGGNPFMQQRQQPPKPKGNLDDVLKGIGLEFTKGKANTKGISFCYFNPHPRLNLQPELTIISSANEDSINKDSDITSGLQEIVMIFGGSLKKTDSSWAKFTPLLKTGGGINGITDWNSLSPRQFGPPSKPKRELKDERLIMAGRIQGSYKSTEKGSKEVAIDVITVMDVDFIGDQFFSLRSSGPKDLNFDNISFFLNCIDTLAKEKSFITLRKKRSRHRTLSWFDKIREQQRKTQNDLEAKAEKDAEAELKEAQKNFDAKVKEIADRKDLKKEDKEILVQTVQEKESRR